MAFKDPKKARAYRRKYYQENKKRETLLRAKWYAENKEHKRARDKVVVDSLGMRALIILGGRCARCGYNANNNALHIDHVHGDGSRERKTVMTSKTLRRKIAQGEIVDLSPYQLLCANCNNIKRIENNEFARPKPAAIMAGEE